MFTGKNQKQQKVAKGKFDMIVKMSKLNEMNPEENYEQKKSILINFRNAPEVGDAVFMYVPLEHLKIDREHYQRPIYSHARKIAEEWDERKCDPLIVNYRNDGFWYIIDGQHRYAAAKENKLDCLVCKCFVGLSVAEESAIFSSVNILSKRLVPYETFKSNICHKEEVDTKIKKICDRYGVKIEKSKELKTLRCITLLRRMLKREKTTPELQGRLEWCMQTIRKTSWHNSEKMAYSYKPVYALSFLWEDNQDTLEYVQDKIVNALENITYKDVCAFANLEYPLMSPCAGFATVIRNIANGEITITDEIKNRIYTTDKQCG